MKSFLKTSTSTIGGATIIIVISILLGDKSPWFIEKLYAYPLPGEELKVDVNDIFIDRAKFKKFEQGDYIVDHKEQYVIKKPSPKGWHINNENPGNFLGGISIETVPFYGFSMSLFSKAYELGDLQVDDLVTTSLLSDKKYKIGFTGESKIGGFDISLNPADDKDFVKTSIMASAELFGEQKDEILNVVNGDSEEARNFMRIAADDIRAQFDQIIRDRWPGEQDISNNVTIATFDKKMFDRNVNVRLLTKAGDPNFIFYLQLLTVLNPQLQNIAIKDYQISKKNDVVLIDAGLKLENITVNDVPVDSAEIIRTFLLVDRPERINVVALNCFSGPGFEKDEFLKMEEILLSFRAVE